MPYYESSPSDAANGRQPRKRASNIARQNIVSQLAAAYTDGQLSTDEFDHRTAQAWSAKFGDELEALTADLNLAGDQSPTVAASDPVHAPPQISHEQGGVGNSFALMGGVEHSGDWLISAHHRSVALMGGTDLNLLNARFSAQHTCIDAAAIMGGVRIIVPDDVHVTSEGHALMGGFEVSDHPSVTIAQRDLPPDAPAITVTGFALMGGVEIIRAARNARVE